MIFIYLVFIAELHLILRFFHAHLMPDVSKLQQS